GGGSPDRPARARWSTAPARGRIWSRFGSTARGPTRRSRRSWSRGGGSTRSTPRSWRSSGGARHRCGSRSGRHSRRGARDPRPKTRPRPRGEGPRARSGGVSPTAPRRSVDAACLHVCVLLHPDRVALERWPARRLETLTGPHVERRVVPGAHQHGSLQPPVPGQVGPVVRAVRVERVVGLPYVDEEQRAAVRADLAHLAGAQLGRGEHGQEVSHASPRPVVRRSRVQASYRARLRSFFGNGRVRERVRRSAARPYRISQQRVREVSDGFDLKDYVDVAERIRAFYERYPEGSIQTEMVRLEGDLVVFRATVYRDREDPHPTTGWAY